MNEPVLLKIGVSGLWGK